MTAQEIESNLISARKKLETAITPEMRKNLESIVASLEKKVPNKVSMSQEGETSLPSTQKDDTKKIVGVCIAFALFALFVSKK